MEGAQSIHPRVGIIGIGAMGAAVARRLISKGVNNLEAAAGGEGGGGGGGGGGLTLWNRTTSKAEALAPLGAKVAKTVVELVDSSDVIIILLPEYSNAYALLDNDEVGPHLKGRLLLQLSTGGASDARAFESEVANKWQADYLDGAILDFPAGMEAGKASVYISGKADLYDRFKPFLEKLGLVAYAGEEIGNASVLDEAGLSFFMALEVGFFHAMAVCEKEKFPKENFWALVQQLSPAIPLILAPIYDKIGSRNYTAQVDATLDISHKALARMKTSYEKKGIDAGFVGAMAETLEKTMKHFGKPEADVAQTFEYLAEGKKE